MQLDRLPPSYLQVGSTLGVTAPVDVLIVPAYADGAVYALMELAFLRRAVAFLYGRSRFCRAAERLAR